MCLVKWEVHFLTLQVHLFNHTIFWKFGDMLFCMSKSCCEKTREPFTYFPLCVVSVYIFMLNLWQFKKKKSGKKPCQFFLLYKVQNKNYINSPAWRNIPIGCPKNDKVELGWISIPILFIANLAGYTRCSLSRECQWNWGCTKRGQF